MTINISSRCRPRSRPPHRHHHYCGAIDAHPPRPMWGEKKVDGAPPSDAGVQIQQLIQLPSAWHHVAGLLMTFMLV